MTDFSQPCYAATAHASQKQARPKREPAPQSQAGAKFRVDGSPLDAPAAKKPAAEPSRADRLYRKSAKR